jgi:hypothetical protein
MAGMRVSFRRPLAAIATAVLLATAAPPPAEAHDVKRVKRAIRIAWQGNDRRAIRVAKCESSLNPKAVSPSGTYRGLWQFDRATWKAYGGPGNDPIKVGARRQTEVAWRLFVDRGWQPWPTCGASDADTADVSGSGPENTDTRRRGQKDVSRR